MKISLKFVPQGPINNILALVQIMTWCWPGNKPLSEPMMVSLLMYICVTRPQYGYRVMTKLFWFNIVNMLVADATGSLHYQDISTNDIDYVK